MGTKREKWDLKERALTLYSTGKFATRRDAMLAAEAECDRMRIKQQQRLEDRQDLSMG